MRCFADQIESVLISEEELKSKVSELGRQITHDYQDKPLLLVAVLKGSAIFLADLLRSIELPVDYDFVAVSSYGSNSQTSGVVRLLKDVDSDIKGKDVIIVEDIVDTGWTLRLSYLIENMLARGAASVKVCALLDKPCRRKVDIGIDYRGFVIEDHFVVGYGLDYQGRYRNLPYVGILKRESRSNTL